MTAAGDVWPYLVGGFIICLALSLNLWINKRLTSISSIYHGFFAPEVVELSSSLSLLAGLVFCSTLFWNIFGFGEIRNTKIVPFESESAFFSDLGVYGFLLSGFLVGLGTRVAGGGLTGHAFCGVPRLAWKSLIATVTFIGVGFLVSTIKRKNGTLADNSMSCVALSLDPRVTANVFMVVSIVVVLLTLLKDRNAARVLSSFLVGAILAIGLMVSGLARRTQVINFLTFRDSWNSLLLFAFLAVIGGNGLTFNLFLRKHHHEHPHVPHHIFNVIVGSALFGAGLGLCGLTVASALVVSPVYFPEVAVFFLLPAGFGNIVAPYIERGIAWLRGAADRGGSYVRHD